MKIGNIAFIAIGVIVVFFGLSTMFDSFYTIDERERGVVLFNGQIIGTANPGMHWKMPILADVAKINIENNIQKYGVEAPADGTPCDQCVWAYSKDQQVAAIVFSVNYKVDSSRVEDVYREYTNVQGLVDREVTRQALKGLKDVFGQYNAVRAIQERAGLNTEVESTIMAALSDSPVQVLSVQIENIDFSDAYEKVIEERMQAEVEVAKLEQNLRREEVQANIVRTQAQGEADAKKAQAEAEAYRIRAVGEAEAAAIKLRADALANNPGLIELTKAEKWDGQLPQTVLPNSTVPFIDAAPAQ